jgi:type IV pilus assembly protein PilV
MKKLLCNTKQGFSLFEVLIALIILAIGMLGIAKTLLIAHKSNSSNYMRQQAIQSAYDMLDRVNANRQAAINGSYNAGNLVSGGAPPKPGSPSTNCTMTSCSSTDMASYDIWHWLTNDVTQLPNGCGKVATATSGINTTITVTVQWDDSATEQTLGIANSSPSQLIIQSEL